MARIYLIRHGHSPSVQEAGVQNDTERPLSKKGEKEIDHLARELKKKSSQIEIILASPLVRATETARRLELILKPQQGVLKQAFLDGSLSTPELLKKLSEAVEKNDWKEVMVVGHQPQMSELVAYLSRKAVDFKPGGCAFLEWNIGSSANLLWTRDP